MSLDNGQEYIAGSIEKVTYHNEDNGFSVLQIKAKDYKGTIAVVGYIAAVTVGEYIECEGVWHNDRTHGWQFKASSIKCLPPNSLHGMEKYLASGLIKGVGPYFAKKLVAIFGYEVFRVIEQKPELLAKVAGIGKARAESITANWQNQTTIRKIMVFLQSHGIGSARATKIFKVYGHKAIEIVTNNPYQLAKDIKGIGFVSADAIARNLGVAKDSPLRIQAAITHLLLEAANEGHCAVLLEALISSSHKLLEVDLELIKIAITRQVEEKIIIANQIAGKEAIFLTRYYIYEYTIAKTLLGLSNALRSWPEIDIHKAIFWLEDKLQIVLADKQKVAIASALNTKVLVITGGPGTGKTTIVNAILKILSAKNLAIKLCAPTGRAAKRLSESTKLEALTIHRLLEIDPINGHFKYNENNLLDCDYLVIDEASMVDVPLFYSLLKALPSRVAMLIVGDANQLPSVGAGQVLSDIITSKTVPVVKLTEIFRQATASTIITNSHRINDGLLPDFSTCYEGSDFCFIPSEQPEDVLATITQLMTNKLPHYLKCNPINDIQVLCPMQRGSIGVKSLNIELQKALNPHHIHGINKFGQTFAVGDKVMQLENNYDKEVYNGDIGFIKNITETEVIVTFEQRDVIYDYTDLDQLTLSYAITIHKSQGSEYPIVIIVLTMQSFIMLQRNLLYTAITRGKKLVIIIGQKKAVAMAVQNNRSLYRYTKLKEWLGILRAAR